MNDRNMFDAMDACRSGHADTQLPAMTPLATAMESDPTLRRQLNASQRLDSHIKDAMHNVPLPPELANRLLASIRSAATDAPCPEIGDASSAIVGPSLPVQELVPAHQNVAGNSRKFFPRWMVSSAALVAAAILLACGWFWLQTGGIWNAELLSERAPRWLARLSDDWRPADSQLLRTWSLSQFVARAPQRWQPFSASVEQPGAAIDFTRNRGTAMLFVVKAKSDSSLATIPTRLPSSGGWGLGAWQAAGRVYVFVVDERQQRLEDFIRSAPPVAAHGVRPSPLG